jgi:hypothetical protein
MKRPFRYKVGDLTSGAATRFRSGGKVALAVSRLSEPSVEETLLMLKEVQTHGRLSIAAIAGLLGVSYATARSWFTGSRLPCRSARRIVWLLHHLLHRSAPLTVDDWLTWKRD